MLQSKNLKPKVLFDGACHLCSREIEHYKKLNGADSIEWVDISVKGFAASNYGLNDRDVNLAMHFIDENNVTFKGIDAFTKLWKYFPKYKFLSVIVNLPVLNFIFKIFYFTFARFVRPYLPKRKVCESDYCLRDK